jgi:TonB family protein
VASAGIASAQLASTSWQNRALEFTRRLDVPVGILWIALSAFCFGRFVSGIVSLRRRRAQWVAREITGTECFVTPDIGPAVVAMPETRIVVPQWVLDLDADSLATVIRHERQHKIARDGWLIVTGSLAAALVPWNPTVWLMQRRLRLALEMDCDARVLAEHPRVDRYGSLLLAIAQRPQFVAGLAATLTESTSDLERRIDVMTAHPPKNPRTRALLFAAAGVVAIAIACSMPAPDLVAPQVAKPTAQEVAARGGYLEFQVERPASASPTNMPPMYPAQLRAAGIQGTVIAKFVVDTTGHADMKSFEVIKADHEGFVASVRGALPNMRFYPARVGGRPVNQVITMPFAFSLVGNDAPKTGASVKPPTPTTPREPLIFYETPADDSMPQWVNSNAQPTYPNQLRAANIAGQVEVKFVVREDGKVDMDSFMVIKSDHEAFSAAVRNAAQRWQFRPATKNGKPVAKLMTMPFIFSLAR